MAKLDSIPVTLTASADLSTSVWFFGKMTSTGVAVCSTLGERAHGVIGEGYTPANAAGMAVDFYAKPGTIVKLRASAAIAEGAELTPAATGKAVTAVSTNIVAALALEAADAADAIFSALLIPAYAK